MQKLKLMLLLLGVATLAQAQNGYWQQGVKYTMDVTLNSSNHQVIGKQQAIYTNNSPDTLTHVFYHLYFNAFQPGSMMDVRSRTIADPDSRVGDRIAHLSPEEIGFQKIISLKQDGKPTQHEVLGTILKVALPTPILPGVSTTFDMEFLSQVPLQIRRSGRDNKEGIQYSMTQWYPKLSEYDVDGWHPNPYVGREFYGIWGDFKVNITADKNLVIGGTGEITNEKENANGSKTWTFDAKNVHDFAWAADADYLHDVVDGPNGLKIHFYYENEEELIENWKWVQDKTVRLFEIMNEKFGVYPYKKYSVLQGGDGGMEYPQATLITGKRSKNSLMGVIVHEVIHSWYQMILGTNESLYPWMDEGFTTFASSIVMDILLDKNEFNSHQASMRGYQRLVDSEKQEPLSTHADYFHTNFAYGVSSYSKGETFLWQLNYMLGDAVFFPAMKDYYNTWKFKHPTADNFIRIMEKHCDCVLDWYKEGWVNTTNVIDYSLKEVVAEKNKTKITLERVGEMPMPIDVRITLQDGTRKTYAIGNYSMFTNLQAKRKFNHITGQKLNIQDVALKPWPWTHPEYVFTINEKRENIAAIEIDPLDGVADVDRSNNTLQEAGKPIFFKGN